MSEMLAPVANALGFEDDDECPVTALGYLDGQYHFLDSNGHALSRPTSALAKQIELRALLGKNKKWAADKFPVFDRAGNRVEGEFSVRDFGGYLVDQCQARGLHDPSIPLRGVGVWSEAGRVMVHVGDRVLFLGTADALATTRRAGFLTRAALWAAHPPVPPPAPPASAETAQLVERALRKWPWSRSEEWRVLTGLWGAGLLGAATRWRAHGIVVGPPGSGKSTLIDFYGALSPLSQASNDFSEAGLRQLLSNRAAPLLLDEAEEDGAKLQKVVMLLRKASGGKGAQSVRGTGDGIAQTFNFTSPALMGSVLPPALMPQDATRITRMDLLPIPRNAPLLPVADLMQWAADNAHALWGRALEGIPRFNANLVVIKAALIRRGCSPRLSDQVGTIIAARAMMVEDEPLDDYAAEIEVDAIGWLAVATEHQADDNGPMSCLTHLFTAGSDINSGGEHPTIGTLIYRARKVDGDDARRQLVEHGMMLAPYPRNGPVRFLYVANKHSRLARAFEDTQWQAGRWKEDLRHLDGSVEPPNPQWFAGRHKSRCVLVPECLLPGADHDADAPAPQDDEDIPDAWPGSGAPGYAM